jgi:hypothetical protein
VTVAAFLYAVLIGSGLVGFWLSLRLPRFTPRTVAGAAALLVVAFLLPRLALPLLRPALAALPPADAVLVTVLPVFTLTFACVAWALRFLVSVAGGPAVR